MSKRKAIYGVDDNDDDSTHKSWKCGCPSKYVCSAPQISSERNIIVDVLIIIFSTSTWIGINGLFVELPFLVYSQPEQWNLPSYITVVVQVANIGPIIYSLTRRFMPGKIKDSSFICFLLVIGSIALLFLALFYKKTTFVLGQERSLILLLLVFFIALIGCTSSVLFMPYMNNFHEMYIISYFIGEGLSGFVPSIAALVQGVGNSDINTNDTQVNISEILVTKDANLKFSTASFFYFIFIIILFSIFAFLILNYFYLQKYETVFHTRPITRNVNLYASEDNVSDSKTRQNSCAVCMETKELFRSPSKEVNGEEFMENFSIKKEELESEFVAVKYGKDLHIKNKIIIIIVIWVCLLGNGFCPSIQSYSCLPYGDAVYLLSATLGSMANPTACFLAFFIPVPSLSKIVVLTFLSSMTSCYITITALMSPTPPLLQTFIGEANIVLCWILNTGLISYVKVSTASLCRQQSSQALFKCGAGQQVGSAIGALIAFLLINVTSLFNP